MLLSLFDNTQFIYELALAQLELLALGVDFRIKNGLRVFEVLNVDHDINVLKRRLAYFKTVNNHYTDYYYITRKNRTRSVNQYLTHWIYPYKGKFHPQMIRALLNIINIKEGETVLDPFIGSGTTALEAQLLGINCIGFDISPLCVLQSRVKTESVLVLDEIINWKNKVLDVIRGNLFKFNEEDIDEVLNDISNEKVRNFYLMAKLVSISDKVRRKRDFTKSFVNNLEKMILSVKDYADVVKELNLNLGRVDIRIGDARKLPLPDESVDGIITSPPYSIALDYVSNDAHALKSFGYDLSEFREKVIGVRGKGKNRIALYNEDMKRSLEEMYRVLKYGRFAVIIVGNATYNGEEVKTVEFITDYAQKLGFGLFKNIEKIIFGLYNVMQRENILIFKKGK